MTQEIINNIINDVKSKYKDFESPNRSFASSLLLNHLNLYKELLDNYSVYADHDLNSLVCIRYTIEKEGNSWEVCASLVGRYAMVSRQIGEWSWVVVCDGAYTDSFDKEILQIVNKCNFYSLSEFVLKTIIPGFRFEIFYTDEMEIQNWAYVYQVLFFYENYDLLCDYNAEDVN